jgi:hypothetical protein
MYMKFSTPKKPQSKRYLEIKKKYQDMIGNREIILERVAPGRLHSGCMKATDGIKEADEVYTEFAELWEKH